MVVAFSFSAAVLGIAAILALRLGWLVLESALELDVRLNALERGGRVFAPFPRTEETFGSTGGGEVRVSTAEFRETFEGCIAGFPAVDRTTLVRPEVEPTVPRAPCLRFT